MVNSRLGLLFEACPGFELCLRHDRRKLDGSECQEHPHRVLIGLEPHRVRPDSDPIQGELYANPWDRPQHEGAAAVGDDRAAQARDLDHHPLKRRAVAKGENRAPDVADFLGIG